MTRGINWGRGLLAVGLLWGFIFGMIYAPEYIIGTLLVAVAILVTVFLFIMAAGG